MKVPRLGDESKLQPPAYTTATATPDLSHICNLHHSSWQRWILKPLSKVRDWTHNLMDVSRVCYPWATTGIPCPAMSNLCSGAPPVLLPNRLFVLLKSKLQPPAYTTATATPDLSHICNLYHSSWQRWILFPRRIQPVNIRHTHTTSS